VAIKRFSGICSKSKYQPDTNALRYCSENLACAKL